MSTPEQRRGGAPVGYLDELSAVEAGAVLYLRLWCDGPDSQTQVWNDFASTFGAARGRAALKGFEQLCTLAVEHARHPFMRHAVTCRCLGAHEAVFATLVASATRGDREDAMLMAALLVRSDIAVPMTDLAQQFGLALQSIERGGSTCRTHSPPDGTHQLH
ncbi:MAG: hypothetical protein AAF409_02000 [Pseudomonadota bacterium]